MTRFAALALAAFVALGVGCRRSTCVYPTGRCESGSICALVEPETAKCIRHEQLESPVAAPFAPGHRFWCSQGGRSPKGRSHSYQGDAFAIDLVSESNSDAVQLFSPIAGEARVFNGCEERDGSPNAHNNSRCGLGYGNHVKIWDGKYLYLFAHLARTDATSGRINRGDGLGIMGNSGAAGHRHVHVTVTAMSPPEVEKVLTTPGWKGQIPVRFRLASQQGAVSEWVDLLVCSDKREQAALFVQ